jgi:hypothetical protein
MERLKKIFKKRTKPKETATAQPQLERAILPKAERRIKRGNN